MSTTEEKKPWVAVEGVHEGKKQGWWVVTRTPDNYYSDSFTMYGPDAEVKAKELAASVNAGEGLAERMKRLANARAFVAATMIQCQHNPQLAAVCSEILSALTFEVEQ